MVAMPSSWRGQKHGSLPESGASIALNRSKSLLHGDSLNSGLLYRGKNHLVRLIGEGEQFIVVYFRNEWDFVGGCAKYCLILQGGSTIATCFDRQLDNIFRVKVDRVGCKDAPAECSIPWSTGRMEI